MVRIAQAQSRSLVIDRVARVARRVASPEQRRSMLAMFDQGIASLGNFATNIMLARAMSREEYGTFGLVLEGVLFFNAIQAALVTYPLSVKGARVDPRGLGRYTTASLALTGAMAMLVAAGTLVAGVLTGRTGLAICAAAALLCWQIQETLRRAMISHLRFGQAIVGDSISYLGQGAAVALLAFGGNISVEAVFLLIAVTSAAAAAVQFRQVKPRVASLRWIARHARDFVVYGRWQALNNTIIILTWMTYSWTLAWFHGARAVAELYAIGIIVKLANPLMIAIGGLIVSAASSAHARGGAGHAWQVARRHAWVGAAPLLPYLLILICFPDECIRLVHGRHSAYAEHGLLLRLLALGAGLTYISSTVSAYLSGIDQSGRALRAQLAYVGVSVAIGLPLTILGGTLWGTAGMALSSAAQVATLLWFVDGLPGTSSREPRLHIESLVAARVVGSAGSPYTWHGVPSRCAGSLAHARLD